MLGVSPKAGLLQDLCCIQKKGGRGGEFKNVPAGGIITDAATDTDRDTDADGVTDTDTDIQIHIQI